MSPQLDLGQPSLLDRLAQVLAGELLHHEVERARRLLGGRVVARHARVAELRQHLRFALEQLERLPGPVRRDSLDDDLAVLGTLGLGVHGDEQLALRAFAELRAEPVTPADQRSRGGRCHGRCLARSAPAIASPTPLACCILGVVLRLALVSLGIGACSGAEVTTYADNDPPISNGGSGGGCMATAFTVTPVVPYVQLVIDASGSMDNGITWQQRQQVRHRPRHPDQHHERPAARAAGQGAVRNHDLHRSELLPQAVHATTPRPTTRPRFAASFRRPARKATTSWPRSSTTSSPDSSRRRARGGRS